MMRHLLLHICCAPCSSGALFELENSFDGKITLFYYNPNIDSEEEMVKRLEESRSFVQRKYGEEISLAEGSYDKERWFDLVAPLKSTGEKGMRCWQCYYLRLLESFKKAVEIGATHVSTTLSISPHKNIAWLESIGKTLGNHFGCEYIPSTWNYQKSVEISKEYGLYRQNYCGCEFSRTEQDERKQKRR